MRVHKLLNVPLIIITGSILLSGCASHDEGKTVAQQTTANTRALMISLMGEAPPEPDIQELNKHPLGSKENPVKVNGPSGEKHYLSRLNCASGDAVSFERVGSAGKGPYGFVMDEFKVSCPDNVVRRVYIDMYHLENLHDVAVTPFVMQND